MHAEGEAASEKNTVVFKLAVACKKRPDGSFLNDRGALCLALRLTALYHVPSSAKLETVHVLASIPALPPCGLAMTACLAPSRRAMEVPFVVRARNCVFVFAMPLTCVT